MYLNEGFVSLVSTVKSSENELHKCKRKLDPEKLKPLVREANNHSDELKQ